MPSEPSARTTSPNRANSQKVGGIDINVTNMSLHCIHAIPDMHTSSMTTNGNPTNTQILVQI